MKKLTFVLMGVFGLIFTTNVYAVPETDFRISEYQKVTEEYTNTNTTNTYGTTYYLHYNSNTWFEGRSFWELGNWIETPNVYNNYFGSYSYDIRTATDLQNNLYTKVKHVSVDRILIQLPHEEFCPLNKDCRIDTIFRFYSTCDGIIQDNTTQYCRTLNAGQLANVMQNFQTQPTSNHCSYYPGYNGKNTDIGLSCYSPAGDKYLYIDLISLQKDYTPISAIQYAPLWYAVNFYLMYPFAVSGNSITDLANGGLSFFDDNYTKEIGTITSINGMHTPGPLTQLLALPVTFFNRLIQSFNNPCTSVSFGSLWGTNFTLTCPNLTPFKPIFDVVDIFVAGYLAYYIACKLIRLFNKITNLKEGGLEEAYNG